MKNLTKNTMFAAAALVIAAGMAQAQTIKAEVPFSFRASGTVMPAGEYRVTETSSMSGSRMFKLNHVDTNRSILAVSHDSSEQKPGSPEASLTFECGGAHCALVQLAPGSGRTYRFSQPKPLVDENTRVAVIRAILVNGR